jgi:arylsulfatase A-like enzyme
VQVACHYLVPTPYGPSLLATNGHDVPRALVYSAVSVLALVVAFRLLGHALGGLFGLVGDRAALLAFTAAASLYLFIGEMDLELMRWLGQHVSVGWVRAYSWKPDALKLRLFRSDVLPTSIALVLAIVPPIVLLAYAVSRRPVRLLSLRTTGLLAVPLLLGIALMLPELSRPTELQPVQPLLYTVWQEALRGLHRRLSAGEAARGLAFLDAVTGHAPPSDPSGRYPIWREVPNEPDRLARFRARPLDEKLDVVVVLLESAQAWELDLRRADVKERFPSLASLFAERGALFPYCQSVGFPSPEGHVGVHLGIWSHPTERIIQKYHALRTVSFPEILARAGYATALVSAGDPDFDKMQRWFDRWYEEWHYDPARSDDVSAAGEALEVYARMPADRPRFLLFNTITMHAPYTFPGSGERVNAPFHAAYLDAARWADRGLGILFDGLRKSPRWAKTLVLVVGDHSITGPWIGFQAPRAGTPNAAETWTILLLAPPGGAGATVRTELVSQIDVAPTILGLAGVEASSHFLGRDLSRRAGPAPRGAFAFRDGGIGATFGDVRFQFRLADAGFLKKTRYADDDPGCPDPEPYGCYRNGTALPMSPGDAALLDDVRLMARAYGELFSEDRLVPPAGVLPYRGEKRKR